MAQAFASTPWMAEGLRRAGFASRFALEFSLRDREHLIPRRPPCTSCPSRPTTPTPEHGAACPVGGPLCGWCVFGTHPTMQLFDGDARTLSYARPGRTEPDLTCVRDVSGLYIDWKRKPSSRDTRPSPIARCRRRAGP